MGVNSLPKTVTRQRRDCDLNPGTSAPESSTLTTRLPSHPRRLDFAAIMQWRLQSAVGLQLNNLCVNKLATKIAKSLFMIGYFWLIQPIKLYHAQYSVFVFLSQKHFNRVNCPICPPPLQGSRRDLVFIFVTAFLIDRQIVVSGNMQQESFLHFTQTTGPPKRDWLSCRTLSTLQWVPQFTTGLAPQL